MTQKLPLPQLNGDVLDYDVAQSERLNELQDRYVGGGINSYYAFVASGSSPRPWAKDWIGTERVIIVEWYATNGTKSTVISSGMAKIAYMGDNFSIITNSREVTASNITLSLTTDGIIQFNNVSEGNAYLYASLIRS